MMEVMPFFGLGPVRFGMTIEQVRAALGSTAFPFQKTPTSEYPTDSFNAAHLHVYYRSPGVCEAIEVFPPGAVTYRSNRILGVPFSEVRNWMLREDPALIVDRSGLTSFVLGLSLSAPALKAPGEPVESLLLFEKDYFRRHQLTSTRLQ